MKNTSENLKKQRTKHQIQKGITLIALVITVIVLLILAGTAITLSINGGNLFSKTNEAANEWNAAVAKEETAMKNVLSVLDDLSPSPVTVSTEIPDKWKDSTNISKVAIAGGRTVPIPDGFVVSEIEGENTISDGLVIYQTGTTSTTTEGFWTEIDMTKSDVTNTNFLKCQTTYNQFVWIPVDDINSMIMCKKNNLAYTDENEEEVPAKICNIVYDEKSDKIKCTVHNSEDICGRLYTVTNGDNQIVSVNGSNKTVQVRTQDFKENTQTWNTTSQREPDLVEAHDDDTNATITRTQLNDSFKAMAKSVAKYGGFYIGRYEAGYIEESIPATGYTNVKGQTVMTADASSADKWYGLYKHLNTNIEKAKSSMIWGCQYDQVMKFIGTQVQIGHTDRNLPGTDGTSDYRKSGATPLDKMKNIYDLEGNYFEWTAQAVSTAHRIGRGGFYSSVANGNFLPASGRGIAIFPTNAISLGSSRPALYL